jgi:hypothetical protein
MPAKCAAEVNLILCKSGHVRADKPFMNWARATPTTGAKFRKSGRATVWFRRRSVEKVGNAPRKSHLSSFVGQNGHLLDRASKSSASVAGEYEERKSLETSQAERRVRRPVGMHLMRIRRVRPNAFGALEREAAT